VKKYTVKPDNLYFNTSCREDIFFWKLPIRTATILTCTEHVKQNQKAKEKLDLTPHTPKHSYTFLY